MIAKTLDISIKYVVLATSIVVSGVFIFHGSIVVDIISMWGLCIVAILLSDIDLFHPYSWYSVGFALYATAYPILCLLQGEGDICSDLLMELQWLGFSTFLFVVSPRKAKKNKTTIKLYSYGFHFFNKAFVVCALYITVILFFILQGGYTGKREIRSEGNFFYVLFYYSGIVMSLMYAVKMSFLLENHTVKKNEIVVTILIAGMSMFFIAITGERDYIFKFVGITIFLFYSYGVLKNRHFLIIAPFIMILMALSLSFKYTFMTGNITNNNRTIIENFLRSDFHAASRNIQIIIDHNLKGYFSPILIISDIFEPTVSRWLSYEFLKMDRGWGFSMVGFGYIAWGIPGIILVMFCVGVLVKIFYYMSFKNKYCLALYAVMVLIFIYSNRGTSYTVMSAASTYSLFIILLSRIVRRKKISDYIEYTITKK